MHVFKFKRDQNWWYPQLASSFLCVFLVGGWALPLWQNMRKSVGMMKFPMESHNPFHGSIAPTRSPSCSHCCWFIAYEPLLTITINMFHWFWHWFWHHNPQIFTRFSHGNPIESHQKSGTRQLDATLGPAPRRRGTRQERSVGDKVGHG